MDQQFSHWPALPVPTEMPLFVDPGHPCAYLPGRTTQVRAFWADQLLGEEYQALMDAGFRRSGRVVYQPVCPGCRQCIPLRVPVDAFRPSKSQRRCHRRNQDLRVETGDPVPTREKWLLYHRYQRQWHGKTDEETPEDFVRFLYDSPLRTLEFTYRDPAGQLLAVGICDLTPAALSSVYFYFEPAAAQRGLGTFGALVELAWARDHGLRWWYAGYWIKDCRAMVYKSSFRPCELLGTDGLWRPLTASSA